MKKAFGILVIAIFVQSCYSNVQSDNLGDTSVAKTVKPGNDSLALFADHKWDGARKLIAQSDCRACHRPYQLLVAPPYITIAKRYDASAATVDKLAGSIINGSYGKWRGYTAMNKHPKLSPQDARLIAAYILAFNQKR